MTHDRRLYIVSPAIDVNPSDFTLFDEERLNRESDRSEMSKHVSEATGQESIFGLPKYREVPRVKVALKNEPLDFYGYDRWVISTRAKELLEELDGGAFDFIRCETSAPARHSVNNYWLGKVRRVIEEFDREASDYELVGKQYDVGFQKWTFSNSIRILNKLKLTPGHDDKLAFYILDYQSYPIMDGRMVDAIRKSGLRGLIFSPLQAPTEEEKGEVFIKNYEYWHNRGEI